MSYSPSFKTLLSECFCEHRDKQTNKQTNIFAIIYLEALQSIFNLNFMKIEHFKMNIRKIPDPQAFTRSYLSVPLQSVKSYGLEGWLVKKTVLAVNIRVLSG